MNLAALVDARPQGPKNVVGTSFSNEAQTKESDKDKRAESTLQSGAI